METTIIKRIKPKQIDTLFHSDKVNIRYYKARNYDIGDDNKVYTYDIAIRHSEDEDPVKVFNKALKGLDNSI